ncbi:Phosphopantetheine adenylyltransferase / dephospho-CoA kinase [Fasciola hepatica]|uniref:Phosphopantetheine adenylyltransferase / dephospho-CoA kinase n=1 Tax=Fasciola hepatica TaxID=6192 RepID=A0A4E0RDS8_FASHE|nr:Phosphopantetheine adenylyltransferase / dephospho-CoA kinase [Fasciola hepatica]
MTHNSGLLILSNVLHKQKLATVFKFASDLVRQKLFVTLPHSNVNVGYWKTAVSLCYTAASEACPLLDVRFLLPFSTIIANPLHFDVVLSQFSDLELAHTLAVQLDPSYKSEIRLTSVDNQVGSDDSQCYSVDTHRASTVRGTFSHVCLGGTFDRLHNGHKILLSIGGLLATDQLLVGITTAAMLRRKQLAPLILSWDRRSEEVECFLRDIGLDKSRFCVVELNDAFGPPAVRSEFQCIVTSDEVVKTCKQLNKIRQAKGFQSLAIEKIDFVNDARPIDHQVPSDLCESKLSSSTVRFHLLGTLLRPANPQGWSRRGARSPYVIGLAGPSGAGKSALARRLAGLSSAVHVIDCDRLGHEAYVPGTECHQRLLDHFGRDSVASADPPYPIDRARLGRLVFSDPARLKELNAIVWPEIECRVHERLVELESTAVHEELSESVSIRRPVVVLDAAVLLQAKWDEMCDEVWVAILPRDDAERRICERMHLEPTVARERLERQATAIAEATGGLDWWSAGQLDKNVGPVGRAHVVLSTQWEPECTQKQVERAFDSLCNRIPL